MSNSTKTPATAPSQHRSIGWLLFLLLLGSYAYFWQFRGWNEGSRLMLTDALVDHGRIAIDGYEQ